MTNPLSEYLAGFRSASPAAERSTALYGKPLVYLIGAQHAFRHPGAVVEPPPGQDVNGESTFKIAYADLQPPCTPTRFHAREPREPSWLNNLCAQFSQAKADGFDHVELDHSDRYAIEDVLSAANVAADYRLKVIAKNPLRVEGGLDCALTYVAHPNVFGIITERGTGTPSMLDALRVKAGKAGIIPVWFVFAGTSGANHCADQIRQSKFRGMGVSYATKGNYADSVSVLSPMP